MCKIETFKNQREDRVVEILKSIFTKNDSSKEQAESFMKAYEIPENIQEKVIYSYSG